MSASIDTSRAIVLGGGIAGVEAILALQDLAPDRISITLVSADRDFLLKPLAVEEPFSGEPPEQHDLAAFMAEIGGRFVQARATGVRPADHAVELDSGDELAYDALLVALGARPSAPFAGVTALNPHEPLAIDDSIREAAASPSRKLGILVPSGATWPLPAYELALLAERRAAQLDTYGLTIELVTPEERPLGLFGRQASEAVSGLLEGRGIEFCGSTILEQRGEDLICHPGGESYAAGATLALPVLAGHALPGLPHDRDGFVPIDDHARVRGVEDVWAAGDGANFPIKQGGLAAAQADAAAEDIAVRFAGRAEATPFAPMLRGQLLTGGESLHMRHDLKRTRGEGEVSTDLLWWPPAKVVGKYLPAFLDPKGFEGDAASRVPIDVEVGVNRDWHSEPMIEMLAPAENGPETR